MKTNTKQSIAALLVAGAMTIPFVFAANEPENVHNVAAASKDATTLTVSWDDSKDYQGNDVDHYRIYYGTASVQGGDAPSYEVEVDTPNSAPFYDLTGLSTDTPYYLSVTAIDSLDLESLEYSIEASGTPVADEEAEDEGDLTSPTVLNVVATDMNHVLVGFSEEVKLPELLAEAAFTITEQIDPTKILDVISAEQYEDDIEGKTVVLETADQTKNVNYIMTASVAITDLAGNPIQSGSTDSGLFVGSDQGVEPEEEPIMEDIMEEDTSMDDLLNAVAGGECSDWDCIIASSDTCTEANYTASIMGMNAVLTIQGAEAGRCRLGIDSMGIVRSCLFETNDLKEKLTNWSQDSMSTSDYDNAECDDDAPEGDTTPPEDITNLIVKFTESMEKFIVNVSWTPSINTAKDFAKYIVYLNTNGGGYKKVYTSNPDPSISEYMMSNVPGMGQEFIFKVTTTDLSGNESVGVIKSIRLPQTGFGAGILLLLSAGTAHRVLRRKNKKDIF